MWLMRVPNLEPLVKTQSYERGSYFFFDQSTWDTLRKVSLPLNSWMYSSRLAVLGSSTPYISTKCFVIWPQL